MEEDPSIASDDLRERLERPIDDLGLSVRALNSLKNSSIRTLKDLVELAEEDLLKVKNVGEKALSEIGELLQREGLSFGMSFDVGATSPADPLPASDPAPGQPTDGGSQGTF